MINVTVKVTASHLGFFQFRLCTLLESDYDSDILTQCFEDPNKFVLLEDESGNTEFSGNKSTFVFLSL